MSRRRISLIVALFAAATTLLATADDSATNTPMAELATANTNTPPEEPATRAPEDTVPAHPGSLQLRPGLQLQLVASAPNVVNPVALAFDADGRLYVAEGGTSTTSGRIKRLEDKDGDGKFEHVTTFRDELPNPTALVCYGSGVFVASDHQIAFLPDANVDGKADGVTVVYNGLKPGGTSNREGITQLAWGLDNRIHVACQGLSGNLTCLTVPSVPPLEIAGHDFAFNPRTLATQLEPGGDTLGLTFDSAGRRFTSSTRQPVQFTVTDPERANQNPLHPWPDLAVSLTDGNWRIFPLQVPTNAAQATSSLASSRAPTSRYARPASLLAYRAATLPREFANALFLADPELRIVSHWEQRDAGVVPGLQRPASGRTAEFIASRDPRFRPVQIIAAPDGSLCIADLDRADLDTADESGHLWRVQPEAMTPARAPKLSALPAPALIDLLGSNNGWVRDTAARLLFERNDPEIYHAAAKEFRWNQNPAAKLHLLHLLATGDALDAAVLTRALGDKDASVRATAATLAANLITDGTLVTDVLGQLANASRDASPRVRFETVLSLGRVNHSAVPALLANALRIAPAEPWIQSAVLASAHTDAAAGTLSQLVTDARVYRDPGGWLFLRRLAWMSGTQGSGNVDSVLAILQQSSLRFDDQLVLASDLGEGLRASGLTLAASSSTNENQALARRALDVALRGGTAELRAKGIRFLGTGGYSMKQAGDWLLVVLAPGEPEAVQLAAVDALAQFPDPIVTSTFVQRWSRLATSAQNQMIVRLLEQFDRTHALMEALENRTIAPTALTDVQVNLLRNHRDQTIAARALRLYGPLPRNDVATRYPAVLKLEGSAERGRRIFQQRCAGCHTYLGEGRDFGPDLATVAGRTREQLLNDIYNPSSSIAAGYETEVVQRTSNQLLFGLVRKPGASFLRVDQPDGERLFIPQSQVEDTFKQDWSLMPANAAAGLSPAAAADLLTFLRAAPATP